MSYEAPLAHLRLLLDIAGVGAARSEHDVADAVLEGAGRFAQEVLAPLNASGDSFAKPMRALRPTAGLHSALPRPTVVRA